MSRLVLDSGAFIGFERGDPKVRAHLEAARRIGLDLVTTSPVVAQVWRDGRRQALVARLLDATRVDAPNDAQARRAGSLLAKTKTTDVVDALLALLAANGDTLLTSDPKDLQRLVAAASTSATVVRI